MKEQKIFVPKNFLAKKLYCADDFKFVVLDEKVAEQDYEAVMSSQKALVGIFGPDDNWPEPQMTLAENKASLKIHGCEFATNKAFAYSIFKQSANKCIGSVYIDPSRSVNYDCEVHFWLRNDELILEQQLFDVIKTWFKQEWPFQKIAFPGREISWQQWQLELANS